MITYNSRTGEIKGLPNIPSTFGYSGHEAGLNNPNMEQIPAVGPIPRGNWKIVRWEDHHGVLGPQVAILLPDGWDAFGRTLFRIHGDNASMNHTASDGCIVADREIRDAWRASNVMKFEVI